MGSGSVLDVGALMVSKGIAVREALELIIPLNQNQNQNQSDENRSGALRDAMRYSLLSQAGKRVCPFLCIVACELVGGSQHTAMPIACALEMLHVASLIHDDLPCMDDADLRRGLPSNHKVFGEALAVLAADALFALAIDHVSSIPSTHLGIPAGTTLCIVGELCRSVGSAGMVAGQYLDLSSQGRSDITLETLEGIHLRKTAVLVECSLVCGALVGGDTTAATVESLRQYGRNLGLLYQVIDDILDVTAASSADLGKTPGKDALAGKVTYPKLLGLKKSKEFATDLARRSKECLLASFDAQKASPLLGFVDLVVSRIGGSSKAH